MLLVLLMMPKAGSLMEEDAVVLLLPRLGVLLTLVMFLARDDDGGDGLCHVCAENNQLTPVCRLPYMSKMVHSSLWNFEALHGIVVFMTRKAFFVIVYRVYKIPKIMLEKA